MVDVPGVLRMVRRAAGSTHMPQTGSLHFARVVLSGLIGRRVVMMVVILMFHVGRYMGLPVTGTSSADSVEPATAKPGVQWRFRRSVVSSGPNLLTSAFGRHSMPRFARSIAVAAIAAVGTRDVARDDEHGLGLRRLARGRRLGRRCLMVRAYPSATSRILVGYPDGVTLEHDRPLHGRCSPRRDGGLPISSEQREQVRDVWCEVWLDPHGTSEFRNGWVFGRYIEPDSY